MGVLLSPPVPIITRLVVKPFQIYLDFLFWGEKVVGQDSPWSFFLRELDDYISLKKKNTQGQS